MSFSRSSPPINFHAPSTSLLRPVTMCSTTGGDVCTIPIIFWAMADDLLDAILDEELERLELFPASSLDTASSHTTPEHYFPGSKDCECCRGYLLTCPCTSDGSPECEKCSNAPSLPSADSQPTEAPPANNFQFSRAIQASAAAVQNSTTPMLARAPSVTSTQEIFNFSVKMFPPPSSVLSRDMFKMMFLPGVRSALSLSPADDEGTTSRTATTAPLGWPDRGWRTQQEFETEVEAALQSRSYNTAGIIIARKQSEEEANALVAKLRDLEVCRTLPCSLT
jgi:hypothetical protein